MEVNKELSHKKVINKFKIFRIQIKHSLAFSLRTFLKISQLIKVNKVYKKNKLQQRIRVLNNNKKTQSQMSIKKHNQVKPKKILKNLLIIISHYLLTNQTKLKILQSNRSQHG
jgi:hypothetical protein